MTRWRWTIVGALAALAVGIVVAVAVEIRVDSGQWRVPETKDFVRIERRLEHKPSHTIFMERHAVDLRPGNDDAAAGLSSIVSSGINKPVKTRSWTGGDARWKQLMACVERQFAPFAITVTDQRPTTDDFIMVAVGGKPGDVGIKEKDVAGLSPFSGAVIPRTVVFAFSAATDNDVETNCETIAMEVGHSYGLDHEYLCKDVMTYLRGCGAKHFVDETAPCGEAKKRACETGGTTQNSYRHLISVLGAHP
jgi:hypothetical protein